ncbi:hypothetical protein V1511DRAFT_495911 [Dipodascopsis uninucleata]
MDFSEIPLSTLYIGGFTAALVVFSFLKRRHSDIHPYGIYNQAALSAVRNADESCIYRSTLTPFTHPLMAGFTIKDGYRYRDGDLLDVWRAGNKGKIGTFDRTSNSVKYSDYVTDLEPIVNKLGAVLKTMVPDLRKVALVLPSGIEDILVNFSCALYGIITVPIPVDCNSAMLFKILNATQPDIIITSAGIIDFTDKKLPKSIKAIIVDAKDADNHLDWADKFSEQLGRDILVKDWSKLCEEADGLDTLDINVYEKQKDGVVIVSPYIVEDDTVKFTEFTHSNIVSAVAAQIKIINIDNEWTNNGVFVPLSPISNLHTRILVFVAIVTGTSVVFCGTSGKGYDIEAAIQIEPTIIAGTSKIVMSLNEYRSPPLLLKLRLQRNEGLLAQGNLPSPILDMFPRLKYLYIHEICEEHSLFNTNKTTNQSNVTALTSAQLSHLRALFGAHVIYSLTHPKVAGAICQTNAYDYRNLGDVNIYGPPLPSLEAVVRDASDVKGKDRQGHLFVEGPAVAGQSWTETGLLCEWRKDGCLQAM